MAAELTPMQFIQTLMLCVKEYKRQIVDTRDDKDAACFYSPKLKKFLVDYRKEISLLSSINFEKSFTNWFNMYIYSNDRIK